MEDEVLTFNATILKQNYYNSDSSWGTYQFLTKDDIPHYIQSKDYDNDTKISSLVGNMQELMIGAEYLIKAKYSLHKTYGHQYNPIAVYAVIPKSKDNQMLFLKSLIPERIAESLLKEYPDLVNDVISGKLKNLDYSKIKGVGEKTWFRVRDKIINNYLISDIITMLKPLGVTFNMIKKLLEDEPNPSLLIKKNRRKSLVCF